MPSTSIPKPLKRTRSPTWKGRADSSTTPAKMLPNVCWLASPSTIAVNPAPAASVPGLSPAMRRPTRAATASVVSWTTKPAIPAVPGSSRRSSVGCISRPTLRATAQPSRIRIAATPMRTGPSTPSSSWR